jgi:hypothetical protein
MPVSFDYSIYRTIIACTRCTTTVEVEGRYLTDLTCAVDGRLVTETFAWHRGHHRPYTMCRECTRANRRAQPRRATSTATMSARAELGISRKFGVEFEMYGSASVNEGTIHSALLDAGLSVGRGTSAWTVKGDGSLGRYGVEVTSPALSGEAGLDELRVACRVFNQLGLRVDRSCGTHVHHDAADLTVDDVKRVARGWSNNHTVIDRFVSSSRRAAANPYYCRPLSSGDLRRIDRCTNLMELRSLGGRDETRYRTFNVNAYGLFGTLEIRQHQGTTSYEKVATWIALGQAIIDTAKVDGEIADEQTVTGFLTRLGDRLDETAATFLTGRAVQFGMAVS